MWLDLGGIFALLLQPDLDQAAFILSPNCPTEEGLFRIGIKRLKPFIKAGGPRSLLRPALPSDVGETTRYPENARSTRGMAQPAVILFRQIQQAPFRELIGVFSKAAAAVGLLFQK
jgi:hypothetical protein